MNTTTQNPNPTRIPFDNLEAGIRNFKSQTTADREKVAGLIAETGAQDCYRTHGTSYVAFTNAKGAVVAYLHHGYLTILDVAGFKPEGATRMANQTTNCGRGWDIHLSTFGTNSGGGTPKPELRYGEVCTKCFETASLSGACAC